MVESNSKRIEKICLGHFLGYCPTCQPNEGPDHPNNLDCVGYIPVTVGYFRSVSPEEYNSAR